MIDITKFLDDEGRIKVWPSKFVMKKSAIEYLANKFCFDQKYSEKEINQIINEWHLFNDPVLLRRSLIDYGYFTREKDGSMYWRIKIKE